MDFNDIGLSVFGPFLVPFFVIDFSGCHANKVGLTSCQYLAVLLLGTVATGPGKRNLLHGYGPWLFCMKPSVLLENIGLLQYFYIYPIIFFLIQKFSFSDRIQLLFVSIVYK